MGTILHPTAILFVLAIVWIAYFQARYFALLKQEEAESRSYSSFSSSSQQPPQQRPAPPQQLQQQQKLDISRPYISPISSTHFSGAGAGAGAGTPFFFVSTANAEFPTQMPLLIRMAQALLFLGPDQGIYWVLVEEEQSDSYATSAGTTTHQHCSLTIREFLLEYMAPHRFPFAHLCPTITGSPRGGEEENNNISSTNHIVSAALNVIQTLGYGTNAKVFFGQASHLADVRFLNELKKTGTSGALSSSSLCRDHGDCKQQQHPTMPLSVISVMPGRVHLIKGESWSSPDPSTNDTKAKNNNNGMGKGYYKVGPHYNRFVAAPKAAAAGNNMRFLVADAARKHGILQRQLPSRNNNHVHARQYSLLQKWNSRPKLFS